MRTLKMYSPVMDKEVLLNPVFWIVIALLVGIWKLGTWFQHIHEENLRAKEEREAARRDSGRDGQTSGPPNPKRPTLLQSPAAPATACAGAMLSNMNFSVIIERDLVTGLLMGSVPGIPEAHTQGETIEEVRANLAEVIELLREAGTLQPESEFIAMVALGVR
jgi:predicted RNase H-like HicB family nuclease